MEIVTARGTAIARLTAADPAVATVVEETADPAAEAEGTAVAVAVADAEADAGHRRGNVVMIAVAGLTRGTGGQCACVLCLLNCCAASKPSRSPVKKKERSRSPSSSEVSDSSEAPAAAKSQGASQPLTLVRAHCAVDAASDVSIPSAAEEDDEETAVAAKRHPGLLGCTRELN